MFAYTEEGLKSHFSQSRLFATVSLLESNKKTVIEFFFQESDLVFLKNFIHLSPVAKRCNEEIKYARVAQLVEHDLAKVGVAGSNPVSRSKYMEGAFVLLFSMNKQDARVVEW